MSLTSGLSGEMFYLGDGAPQDYGKAMAWHLKAAKQGDIDAQFRIGERTQRT